MAVRTVASLRIVRSVLYDVAILAGEQELVEKNMVSLDTSTITLYASCYV